jgi:hypothetical protein
VKQLRLVSRSAIRAAVDTSVANAAGRTFSRTRIAPHARRNELHVQRREHARSTSGRSKPSSGQAAGITLTGIDVPTLRDVWATAPYLHDGSAADAGGRRVSAHQGVTLTATDLSSNLVAFLQQIGKEQAPEYPRKRHGLRGTVLQQRDPERHAGSRARRAGSISAGAIRARLRCPTALWTASSVRLDRQGAGTIDGLIPSSDGSRTKRPFGLGSNGVLRRRITWTATGNSHEVTGVMPARAGAEALDRSWKWQDKTNRSGGKAANGASRGNHFLRGCTNKVSVYDQP